MTAESILAALRDTLAKFPLLQTMGYAVALLVVLFVIIVCLELRAGGNVRRYRSRGFVTDVIYALVYQGGIYHTLIYAPIFTAIALVIPETWHLSLLTQLSPLAGFLVFWVLSDAIGYWIHRWQHRSPLLWRFHSVHHAQTCLTYVTSYRNHILEQLYVNLLMYVPLMLLGMPKWYWAPAMLLQHLFEALQHSDLQWRYGRLYPFLVSPVFHAIHHSPERERHDSNYGKILSVWDWLFGTMSSGERPREYGVAGLEMPATFWGTCLAPFRGMRGTLTPGGAASSRGATPREMPATLQVAPADPSARDNA